MGNRVDPEAQVRADRLTLTPGGYKALTDAYTGSNRSINRNMVPDTKRGFAQVPQTKEEIIAQGLGTKTMKSVVEGQQVRQTDMAAKRRSKATQKFTDLVLDIATLPDKSVVRTAKINEMQKIIKQYPHDPESSITSAAISRNIPAVVREKYGISDNMSMEQIFKLMTMRKYE